MERRWQSSGEALLPSPLLKLLQHLCDKELIGLMTNCSLRTENLKILLCETIDLIFGDTKDSMLVELSFK